VLPLCPLNITNFVLLNAIQGLFHEKLPRDIRRPKTDSYALLNVNIDIIQFKFLLDSQIPLIVPLIIIQSL